jgi:iron(III) transport system ATP-binding protein
MSILQLQNITKKYSGAEEFAVSDISFEVEQGEILALVGESGSGKTTLLRLIAGLEHPEKGEIILSGEKIAGGHYSLPAHKRHIGLVFQDYALFPHLTIMENVLFGLSKGITEREKIARQVLALVNLKENFNKYPHQLSGGQQQRVALARALAPNPKILLLDEPFSNLDATLKDQVREEIRQIIKKTGITAIFVTHDTKDALSTADRIAILYNGHLQQLDNPRRLYESPVNAYVANFFSKQNNIKVKIKPAGLETSFGSLQRRKDIDFEGDAQLIFRPEQARIILDEADTLSGQIVNVAYFGDHQIVKITDETGHLIDIKTASEYSFDGLKKVFFTIDNYILRPYNVTASKGSINKSGKG